MRPAYVRGLGLWTAGAANPAQWCRGALDPSITAPAASLLAGPLRRRASALTRMAVEVFEQAATEAGCDLASVPSVWATAHGEHATAIRILGMLRRGEGKLSPTHFHNSVHNTASGYASIATGNGAASTTLTGGAELVASALLEGLCHLEAGAEDVALVLADEPSLPPFEREGMNAPLALAFGLSTRREGALASLSGFRRDTAPPVKRHERFGDLFVAAALPLLERIALQQPGAVALEFEGAGPGPVYCVDVELVEPRVDPPDPNRPSREPPH